MKEGRGAAPCRASLRAALRIVCQQQHISCLSTPRGSASHRGVLSFWPAATVQSRSMLVVAMHQRTIAPTWFSKDHGRGFS
jgi:hypothetical protein